MNEDKERFVIEVEVDGVWLTARHPATNELFPLFTDHEAAVVAMIDAYPKTYELMKKGMPAAVRVATVVLA